VNRRSFVLPDTGTHRADNRRGASNGSTAARPRVSDLGCWTSEIERCCPRPGSPCEELTKADRVFIAEVLEATSADRTDEQGRPYSDGITSYHFNVVESFKGIDAGEFRAQFYFGLELDGFQPGRRYLIFAKRAVHGNL
jgi:hypothetical protein